jgi:hypothetical protein
MPNLALARAELELQRAEMELSVRRMAVRKLQMNDELSRIQENEAATALKTAEIQASLAKLEKE